MLVGMAAPELPMWFIHRQIASTIHIVIQVARLSGGQRKIVQVSEITGVFGESINMHDIFTFQQTGVDAHGDAEGQFRASGIVPNCLARFAAAGLAVPLKIFEEGQYTFDRLDPLRGF
jgi:pilus assembly protein CpaF